MNKLYPQSSRLSCFCLIAVMVFLTGCAYRLGSPDRTLPGGYKQVLIPIFKNRSLEPQIEVAFTNSLIQEFERSRIARLSDQSTAEVIAEGVIDSIEYSPGGKIEGAQEGTIVAAQYQILIRATVFLKRASDKSLLWQGQFSGERTYVAPQVRSAGINTVNPLYNLSARRQNIEVIAAEMMSEAHDRMTENF